jgi:hypothetical protein
VKGTDSRTGRHSHAVKVQRGARETGGRGCIIGKGIGMRKNKFEDETNQLLQETIIQISSPLSIFISTHPRHLL